jgi:8-oxo-dGTP diphosphatase
MDIRVAAYAVITDDDDRVLLAHWNEGRHAAWTLPGGGLEAGEDPERAVRREVREETGYRIALDGLLGIHSRVIPTADRIADDAIGPLHALRIVYRAHTTGGRLRNEVGGSTDRAEWFPLAQARRLQRVKLVDIAFRMAGIAHPDAVSRKPGR